MISLYYYLHFTSLPANHNICYIINLPKMELKASELSCSVDICTYYGLSCFGERHVLLFSNDLLHEKQFVLRFSWKLFLMIQ